ncbi:bromodomain protein, putative [Plasmodium berghei]|uniref:Bromodomain protein, putative n=2 Tax=Plasmodium berghei TaxID=5821 RepID=A0A509AS58_PLABA|nr:bromodomain protein, putative [Plasmodium berghei ANKA]SCM26849.1 bromodomain protein, putative [Plasmodium berghei]SCN28667.1 bromodomain protein, putative [Plasmodium berghei]SCO62888.1 bromodomain protein, putative [Plasmodium berghei]VUC58549.1 bromodomain protein, putative [Plasmodium berghei ANKA]|eukprot:XP_034424312.1 bromodomain protein, putative [Plasmodium berghei ANKA]
MDLTDSFLNIENNDLKRKDNAYIYLNEKGGNITLNNMNKSGQELTEKKKKNNTLGLNQENLLLKILKNNELIWKKKEDRRKFLSKQNLINSNDHNNKTKHNDINTHMCNGYLPAYVKENENVFYKTSYELYNMIKYQNIDKCYKTDNLINFYNDQNILNYKKIKRKNENKNKYYIDKNNVHSNDLESNILSFESNNFSSNYLLESFNNKLVNNYINIHNTDYIEIQDIFDESKLNNVKNKNLCFYKNVDLKKFIKNENNYMNEFMNPPKKKNNIYSQHLKENQIHSKNEINNNPHTDEIGKNIDNISIYEENSQIDIINNNIYHNDVHDYIPNNLNDNFIDEIKSDQNKFEEYKNNISDNILDFDLDKEFHFNDDSLGGKYNKNENEKDKIETLECELIFSEKDSSKFSDKNDSLMDIINDYNEEEIGYGKKQQIEIAFENVNDDANEVVNVNDFIDIEFLDKKEKITDLKNSDEISEQISDFFFDGEKKEKLKLEDEYCKNDDDKYISNYELNKSNINDNILIMNDVEGGNINGDKDDVENVNNVYSQINEEHEIIKDFDLNKEKTDFYNSVVYSFGNNYNNKDNYTHLKQNNNDHNIFKNIYQEYYHSINNDNLKSEIELFGNHIINNSYIFMLLNYKYIKNYNYNNSIYPFNSDDYTNYIFKNRNLDKNILQNENIIQEIFGTNDDKYPQKNNKLKKKIKNRSSLKHMQNIYHNSLFSDPHLLKNMKSSILRNKNTNIIQNENHIINPCDINKNTNLVNKLNENVVIDTNRHINNSNIIKDSQNIDHNNGNNILDSDKNKIISNMIKHKGNYNHEENDDECSEHFNEKYYHTYHYVNNNKLLKKKKKNEMFYMDFNTYLDIDHNNMNRQKESKIYLGNFTKIMNEFKMADIQYNENYIFDKLNEKLLHEVEKNDYISYMLRNIFLKEKKYSDILLKCLIYKPDEYQNVGTINFHNNILNEKEETYRIINKKTSNLSNIDEEGVLTTLEKMKKTNKIIKFDDSYFINNKKNRLECAENILKKTKNIIFFSHLKLDNYYKKNNPHEIENMILSYNNVYVNSQMTKDYYYSFELSNKKGVIAFSRFHKLDFRTGIHKYYHEYKKSKMILNDDFNKFHELENLEEIDGADKDDEAEDAVPWGWKNIEKNYLAQKDENLIISSYWNYIIPEVAKTHSYFNHPINKFFKLGNRQNIKNSKHLSICSIDKYENANKYFNGNNKNYYIRKTFKNIVNILNNENFNFDSHILDAWAIEKAYDHSIFDEDDGNENINIDNNINGKTDNHAFFFYNNSCLLLNDDSPLIILEYVEKDPFIILKLGMNSKINHYFTTKDDESLYSLEYKNKLKKYIEPFGEINVIKDYINYFGVPIKIKKQNQKLTFIENEIFKALLFTIPVYSMHKENDDYSIFDEPSQAINEHLVDVNHFQKNDMFKNVENINHSDNVFIENQQNINSFNSGEKSIHNEHIHTNSEIKNYSNIQNESTAKHSINEKNHHSNIPNSNDKDDSNMFYNTDFLLIRNISNNGKKYYIKPFYVDIKICKNIKENNGIINCIGNNINNSNKHNDQYENQMNKSDQYKTNNYNKNDLNHFEEIENMEKYNSNNIYVENINNQYREGNENYLNINYTNCIFYNVGFLDMHVSTYNPFYKKYIDEKRNYIRSWLIKLITKHQIKDSKKIKEILKTKLNTFINDKDINAIVKSVDINFILSKEYRDDRNNKNSYKSKNVCILECIYHFIQLYKYEGINFKNILENQEKLNKIIFLLNIEKERANNNIINIKKKMKIIYDKYCYKSEAKSIQFSLNKEDIYIDMIDNYHYVGSHFYDKNLINYFLYIRYLISCSPWNILKDYSTNLSTSKYSNNNNNNNTKQEIGRKKKTIYNKKYDSLNKKKKKNKLKNTQQKLKIRKNKYQFYYDQKDNDTTSNATSNDNDQINNIYSDDNFERYDKKNLRKKKKKNLNQYRKRELKNKQDSDIFEMIDEENKEEKIYHKKKKNNKVNKGENSFSELSDFSFSEEDNDESADDDKHSNSSNDEKRKKNKNKNDGDNKKKNKKNYSYAFYLFNHIICNEKIQQKIGNKKNSIDNSNYNDASICKNNAYLKKQKYQQNLKYKGRNSVQNIFFQKNETKKKGYTNFAKDNKGYTFHGKGKYNFSYFNANKRMSKGKDEFKNETQIENTKKNSYNELSGIEEYDEEINKYDQDINKKENKKEHGNYYLINNTFNLARKDKGKKKYMKYLENYQNLKNKQIRETQNYVDEFNNKEITQNINFINIYRVIEYLSGKDIINILLNVGFSMINIKKMNRNDQINKLRKYIENGTITNQNKIIYITMIKKIILEQFKNLHFPVYLKYNNNVLYLNEKKITSFFNNVDELNKLTNNTITHSGDINIKRTKKVEKNRVKLIKDFFKESINDDSACSSDMGTSSGSDSQLGGGLHDNEIGKKKKKNEFFDDESEEEEEEKKELEIIREMQAKNNNIEDNENNYKLIHCLKWTRIYIRKRDNSMSIYEFTESGENYGNIDADLRADNYENNYKECEINPNKNYKFEIMKKRKEILLKNSFKGVEKYITSENNYIENVQTLYIYGKKNIETFLKWKHFRTLIKKYFTLMQNKESEQRNLDAVEINQLNPKKNGDDSYTYNDQITINDNILFNNGIVKKRKYKKHKKKNLETPESFKTIINIFPTVGDDIKHWNTDKKYSEQNNLKTEKKKLKDKFTHGNEYAKNKDTKKKNIYDLSGDNNGKIINKKFMNTNYSINIKKNNKRYRQNTTLKRKDKNIYNNNAKSNLSISKNRKGGKLQSNQKSYNNATNNEHQNKKWEINREEYDRQIKDDEYNMIDSGKKKSNIKCSDVEDENDRKKKKRKKDKYYNEDKKGKHISNADEYMNKANSTTEKYIRCSSMVSENSVNLNARIDKNPDESSRTKLKKGNTYNNIKEIIENFNEKLLTIMKDISQVLNYKAFLNQVNETYAPMYYSVIKKPMYINKIIFRCKKRKYNNLSLFIDDVYLIVTNCKLYNTPTSVSAYLREIVDNMFLDIFNKIKGDDNLQNYNSILIDHFYKNKHFNNTWESINMEQSDLFNNSELSISKTNDLSINNIQQENLSSNFIPSIDTSRNYNNTMDTDFNLNTMFANFNSSNFHNMESDTSMNKLKDEHDNTKE